MAFLEKLKKKILQSGVSSTDGNGFDSKHSKRRKHTNLLITDRDPASIWEIIGELGDGLYIQTSVETNFLVRFYFKSVQDLLTLIRT
jgi:hypothetical protein